MSVGSISFWQQDVNYWNQSASASQSAAQTDAVISAMFGASTTLSSGLASLANQTALNRVNTQLTAAVQSALASINGGSSSTGSTTSSSSSSSASSSSSSSTSSTAASVVAAPAVGTGTAPLTASTSLFTLGIVAKGTISVSDGTNTTTYTSTGSDTVGDLLNAINKNGYGNAQVAAWLDNSGKLVISGKNDTAMITVGGTDAANVGFGIGHTFFQPTAPSPSSSAASTTSSVSTSNSSSTSTNSSSSTSKSSTSAAGSSAASFLSNSALALQTGSTAETLLSSDGLSGNIVNLIA